MAHPVRTVRRIGDQRVHRFQVLREHRAGEIPRDWIVVELGADALTLASPDFAWSRRVDVETVADGSYEPLVAGGVPVWGY